MDANINSYISSLFDFIRIVDPISNEVINKFSNKYDKTNRCYNFWGNNDMCKNCISVKAFKCEDELFTKIEQSSKGIYLVIGKAIQYNGNKYVLEAIKDLSKSNILDVIDKSTNEKMQKKVDKMSMLVALDELTECFNRRYLSEKLPIEMKNAIKKKKDLAIIMLDIDFFKKVNDTYGHLIGDHVLKEVVKVTKKNIRSSTDWIARYGGEEFVIVLNDTNSSDAIIVAEKIRTTIENTVFNYKDITVRVTVSIGVTNLTDDIKDVNELLEKVDKNLYKAKNKGRNVCVSDENFFD